MRVSLRGQVHERVDGKRKRRDITGLVIAMDPRKGRICQDWSTEYCRSNSDSRRMLISLPVQNVRDSPIQGIAKESDLPCLATQERIRQTKHVTHEQLFLQEFRSGACRKIPNKVTGKCRLLCECLGQIRANAHACGLRNMEEIINFVSILLFPEGSGILRQWSLTGRRCGTFLAAAHSRSEGELEQRKKPLLSE